MTGRDNVRGRAKRVKFRPDACVVRGAGPEGTRPGSALPQREQSEAKDLLRAVVYAPRRAEAVKAREVFARRYRPWYPKAVEVLEDDWERMVSFYDFPEDHWKHLRTTNENASLSSGCFAAELDR